MKDTLSFLDPDTNQVRRAHPFSAIPTAFLVHVREKTYWANCAWDCFGIVAAVHELDYHIGRVLDDIDTLGLRDNTIVIFTSDNGPWNTMQEELRRRHHGAVAWARRVRFARARAPATRAVFGCPRLFGGRDTCPPTE
jgi:Sulfatase